MTNDLLHRACRGCCVMLPLGARLGCELGFEFARRTGNGPKRALNTTVISGRAQQADPRSLIVFYRSHLGGFGNLLETLLERRDPRAKKVMVQSDLCAIRARRQRTVRYDAPFFQRIVHS
jgi:hypothetical protein